MSEFKLCKNGHHYQATLEDCPYCPKPGGYHTGPNQLKNTVLSDRNQSDWDHTRIETSLPEAPPTPVSPVPVSTPSVVPATSFTPPLTPPVSVAPPSLARTQLHTPEGAAGGTANRKLVGWLVSYTLNPSGADFRVYEGRNSLGVDPGCDIVVPHDPAVSARHLTLLYRADGFRFKDELSTNGTFINEVMRDEGLLHDGDLIRVGSTVFKFRSAL
jgi:hypothetical protein